jgi:hypothetical protein
VTTLTGEPAATARRAPSQGAARARLARRIAVPALVFVSLGATAAASGIAHAAPAHQAGTAAAGSCAAAKAAKAHAAKRTSPWMYAIINGRPWMYAVISGRPWMYAKPDATTARACQPAARRAAA